MKYTDQFFDYVDSGAMSSARVLIGHLFPILRPSSVLDIGCGRGGWLLEWRRAGCQTVQGVDGDYVNRTHLHIEQHEFHALDLSARFDLCRRFDVVQCLEVAEHLEPSVSEVLIDNIVRHGDLVWFSAAQPGQGGTQHVNERSLEHWRDLFNARGYDAFDCVRPKFHGDVRIEPWYRFNSVVYANRAGKARLPPEIGSTKVGCRARFPEFAPLIWRLRRVVLMYMPVTIVDKIAALVNAVMVQMRKPPSHQ